MNGVRIKPITETKLNQIIAERLKSDNPVISKQGIIAELVNKAHKREVASNDKN